MNKTLRLLTVVAALLGSAALHAARIGMAAALQRATEFMSLRQEARLARSTIGTPRLTVAWEAPAYYAINAEDGGWVIVGAEAEEEAVLAYSDCGRLDGDRLPCNVECWLDTYDRQAARARTASAGSQDMPTGSETVFTPVAPMLTSEWNQSAPYNLLTPMVEDPNTHTPKHALTGCVATAVVQIMRYHQWPQDECQIAQLPQPVRFRWELMKDRYDSSDTSDSAMAVAELMAYGGRAFGTAYFDTGSGGTPWNAVEALIRNFGYSPLAKDYHGSNHTLTQNECMLHDELARENGPVLLWASDEISGEGHAFVCDGCDANGFFHMNWGWGGICNGYYRLSALKPDTGKRLLDFSGYGAPGAYFGLRRATADEAELCQGLSTISLSAHPKSYVRAADTLDFERIRLYPFFLRLYADAANTRDMSIGLFDGTQLIDILGTTYVGDFSIGITIPHGLADGTYQLRLMWRMHDGGEWAEALWADERCLLAHISGRLLWLGDEVPDEVAAIAALPGEQPRAAGIRLHDLSGRPLQAPPRRGLYISNGRMRWAHSR